MVLDKNGMKIGIIGYLTEETKVLAPINDVEYEDEIAALNREAKLLKERGVNILIALGHSGFKKDLEIAKYVDDIDLVIGGHTNTFLLNSSCTDEVPETPEGPYPTEVLQSSGRIVRVVQAYAYTKYLGKLHLFFDSNGEIIKSEGYPILLNQDIPKDPEVNKIVNKYLESIDKINNIIVGSSEVALYGDYCRLRECNIGNLITDAIVKYSKETVDNDINIAIIQSGRIRASIDRPKKPFNMTKEDWFTVLPFTDLMAVVTMNGSILRQSLEHAVEHWQRNGPPGAFLQFSGLKVTYDFAGPPGSRITEAKAICNGCGNKGLDNIHNDVEYKVVMCTFLADGGDDYYMFKDQPKTILSFNELKAVEQYLNNTGPVTQKETGRSVIINEDAIKDIQTKPITSHLLCSSGLLQQSNLFLYVFLILAHYIMT